MGKRTRSQRKGSSPKFRASSHRFPGKNRIPNVVNEGATVVDLVHSPVHTAPLAQLKLSDGTKFYVVATEGMAIGDIISIGEKVETRPGNITTISAIPEGTLIHNVETRPGDGGRIARSAGVAAVVETRMSNGVRIRMPSGRTRMISAKCRAAIGVIAGHGRGDKPLLKAGTAHKKAKARGKAYPRVSGVAMNPVDHPHGGGNHQAVHGPTSKPRSAPPGSKVGHIAPKRTGVGRSRTK